MSRLMLLSSLIILGVGCASTGSASNAGPALPLGQPAGEPLLVQGSAITGPHSSLIIADDAMRGRFRDVPVFLKWDYQELTGTVGSHATRLELAEGDDTRFWGNFGGTPVDVTLDKEWLRGRVGTCGYTLQRTDFGYAGHRTCSGPLETETVLDFPAPLLERPLGEKAVLMTLMLINYSGTYSSTMSMTRFARPRVGEVVRKGQNPL